MLKAIDVGTCVRACINQSNRTFVNFGYGDNHCTLFDGCKNPEHCQSPKDCGVGKDKYMGWTTWART